MVFAVEFWGVRGSIACPSPRHVVYGGNTSCLEMTAGDERIILDAGTGIRDLGDSLNKRDVRRAHLFLTHVHWDHINGFPFFAPGYQPNRTFEIRAAHLRPLGGVREVLAGQMGQPTFPVPLETMRSKLVFEDFDAGDAFSSARAFGDDTTPLEPSERRDRLSLRVRRKVHLLRDRYGARHREARPEQSSGSSKARTSSCTTRTYTDDEFTTKVGWGHSTWQEAVRLCRQASVKQLAIFHHDPAHEDPFMADVERQAREMWSGAIVAREGMRIQLG